MDRQLVAVVLAGGTGTRLYPASRADRPKQFLRFGGERSLLERSVDRAGFADERYVVTRPAYADAVREHAPGVAVLEEPAPKDTGPALVYAAARIREQLGDCVLVCLPSDHHIAGNFETTARRAARVATGTEGLVTLGIEPDRPATGYGYIEPVRDDTGEEVSQHEEKGQSGTTTYRRVAQFVEKPDEATAREYVDAGWYWNAGIFAWTPEALLSAAAESPLQPVVEAAKAGEYGRGFERTTAASIDNAVLENADERYVVPASFEWDDLGTWDALARVLEKDAQGNARMGDTLALDTADCVLATDGELSTVGLEGVVVASFGDRTLVIDRSESQRVREVFDRRTGENQ
jgi:mannose-1-phosphate guanylyltransferase